jgi:uncharacterized membrane protein YbaN (DUF454 family)
VAAIVVLGVALRLAGIRQGLPDFVEEAAPFRWALAMWAHAGGAIDWNPHHFIYPSLAIYLHLALQLLHETLGRWSGRFSGPADYHLAFQLDPTPMVLLARALGVAADAVSLVLAARIGERMRPGAGLVAAFLLACSPIMIATSRAIYTDPIMLVLALAALERMQAYRAGDGVAALLFVSALVGLAIGAKYPAVVLLLPLAWTLARSHAAREWWRVGPLALLAVALAFLATSPFVVLDRAGFLRDVRFDQVLASEGLLGATGAASGWRTLGTFAGDLGPVASVLAIAGVALVLWRDRRLPGAAAVMLAGAAFLVPVVASPLRFERYLVGVLPAAALAAGLAASFAVERLAGRARVVAGSALALAISIPALAGGAASAATAARSTQRLALEWCSAHVGHENLILTESYGPPLLTRRAAAIAAESELLPRASPAMRARFLARPWFSAVRIPALVAGTCVVELKPAGRAPEDVAVFPHASDFNRVVYDPRLLAGVDYVITSSAIRARFAADRARYAAPCAFYRLLDSTAVVAARFDSGPGVSGPEIVIYRLPDASSAAGDTLGTWWWTEHIPLEYRARAGALLSPGMPTRTEATGPGGEPAPWVIGLRGFYGSQLAYFVQDLAYNLLELGRAGPAKRLAQSALAIDPASQWTCLLMVGACRTLGDWPAARAAFERTAAANPGRAMDVALVGEYAESLAHTGEAARAAALRDSLARTAAPGDSLARAAGSREAQARGGARR